MTRYSLRPIAVALSVASAVFVGTPFHTLAQKPLPHAQPYPLSAAMEELRQSPFHARSEASALLFPPTRIGFSSSARLTAPPTGDDAPSAVKVFLASWASTTASDLVSIYLLLHGAFSEESFATGLGALAAAPVAVLGGAVGAKLVGAPFGRAAIGSLGGAALGIAVLSLSGGLEDFLTFIVTTAVHAGGVTIGAVG